MATSWKNNLDLYASSPTSYTPGSGLNGHLLNSTYNNDSRMTASSGFTYARYPSSQPTSSTTPAFPQPLLSPPLASHSPDHRPNGFILPRFSSPPSPHNPTNLQNYQSLTSPTNAGYPTSTDFPDSPPHQFQRSQSLASPYSDGLPSPRGSDPRLTGTKSNIAAVLERPYTGSRPNIAGSHGKVSFRGIDISDTTEVPINNGWRPQWLRRWVMSVSIATFLMLAVVGEMTMWLLSRTDVESNMKGLWTFGPVVVTSVIAMLWSRVETQATLYMPWIVLNGRPTSVNETRRKQAHRTILLDYPSMNSFEALKEGFKNRHHIVVASITISIILRAQIILSTAIFYVEIHADGTRFLKARMGILHAVVGVFVSLSGILLLMLYHAPSPRGLAPRDPTSPAGTAVLLSTSLTFLSRLNGSGNASMSTVIARLTGSWYTTEIQQPGRRPEQMFQLRQLSGGPSTFSREGSEQADESTVVYRPWTQGVRVQMVSITVSTVLLAGLCVLFSVGGGRDGLEASGDTFLLWTCLPTLVLTGISLLWTRIDIDNRRLAPFIKLTAANCRFKDSLGLTYMNEFGLSTAGKAMRNQDWTVFLAKCIAMLGWLAPIFTAGLFTMTEIAQTANLELRQKSLFRSVSESLAESIGADVIDSVLLRETPRYPRWTWEELAFPELELVNHADEWPLPNTRLTAQVSALKASLTCETLSLSGGSGVKWECTPVAGSKKQAICGTGQNHTALVASSCAQLNSKFSLNYVWGSCADDGLISVMACNESITALKVHTIFHTEDLSIDTNSIPIPSTTSGKVSDVEANISSAYEALEDVGAKEDKLDGLDGFFRTLVLSRLDLRLERLLLPARQNAVGQAIRLQHGILGAQVLSSDSIRQRARPKLSHRADTDDVPDSEATITASVEYFTSRLTQGPSQTYLLAGLLLFTLIFGLLSLRTISRGEALPKNPGSIAAQASLLADSTLWWRLPDGAEWMDDEDLANCLRGKTFRLGWHKNGIGERTYGIGIVQDEGKHAPKPAKVESSASKSGGGGGGGGGGRRGRGRGGSLVSGRYISMEPGVYSHGDIPLYEKS